jgi:UDP-N-acetylmuramate-alanine ligase
LPSFVCCLSGLFSLGVCAAIHFFGITGSKLCAYASHVARQGYCIQISLEVIPADVIIGHARLKIRSYNSIRRGRIDTATNIIEPIRRVKLTIFNAREEKIIIIIKKGSLPRRKKVIRRK